MANGLLARVPYLVLGCILLLAFYIAGRLIRRVLMLAGNRTQFDPVLASLLGGLAVWVFLTLGLLLAAVVVFPTFKPGDLLAGLGITSVAIGFAFKDILQNWLSGVFILWRRPFQIGDQIRTREFEGTVEDINVRSTILKTYDGERVVVPNSDVYTSTLIVRTAYGIRRSRFKVGIGYGAEISHVRETIHAVLRSTPGVLVKPAPEVYLSALGDSALDFIAYFWTPAEQTAVLEIGDRVAAAIKQALDRSGIDIPYPHRVVLLREADATPAGEARDSASPQAAQARRSED